MLTTSHNMEFKENLVHDDVFTIYHTKKVIIYYVFMVLENDILFDLSINDCMLVT